VPRYKFNHSKDASQRLHALIGLDSAYIHTHTHTTHARCEGIFHSMHILPDALPMHIDAIRAITHNAYSQPQAPHPCIHMSYIQLYTRRRQMVFVAYWCLQAPHPCIRMSSMQLNSHKTNGVRSLLGLVGALPMYTHVDTYQDART
jgi:hypothetical protein